jgi:hypothetical protein
MRCGLSLRKISAFEALSAVAAVPRQWHQLGAEIACCLRKCTSAVRDLVRPKLILFF